MTLRKLYRISCDFPDCTAVIEGGWYESGHAAGASDITRAKARKHRWTRRKGKDLCGSHRGARL